MSQISLNHPKRVITATAGAFIVLGAIAGFKSENPLGKNLAWLITASSAMVATVNEISGNLYESIAETQAQNLLSRKEKKLSDLESKLGLVTTNLKSKEQNEADLKAHLSAKDEELARVKADRDSFAVLVSKLRKELASMQQSKTAEKEQYSQATRTFLSKIKLTLTEHIQSGSKLLVSSVNGQIAAFKRKQKASEYEHVITVLGKLLSETQKKETQYTQWVSELAFNDRDNLEAFITDTLDLFSQVHEELSTQRTKFRNSLNVNERLALRDSVHKQQAIQALKDLKGTFQNQFNEVAQKTQEYEAVAGSNDQFVQSLIKDFEITRVRLAEKDEQIKVLRRPHQFIGGVEQPTAGNAIANYFFKLGYILDGSDWEMTDTGYTLYFYKDRNDRFVDLEVLNEECNPDKMKEFTNSLNLPQFKQSNRASRIYLEIQKAYPTKKQLSDADINLLIGSPQEFTKYITSHPIRYRLIADPGQGKTPTTAVMISEILKTGCTKGNTGKGEKVPHTLVTVSYPDAESSQKDADYPLEPFLKYGNTTASVKSFDDCLADGKYRSHNTKYAAEFFHIWCWDEFDNTINSADDPKGTGESIKHILKQFGHINIGWIVSGQSVMTKQLPGFMNDDRRLFTEIIIDIPKIRKYLKDYGNETLSDRIIESLKSNLDKIEEYVEIKNNQITDDARLLRVALVLDSRSPKLYFLPNLDSVDFDYLAIENTHRLAEDAKRQIMPIRSGTEKAQMTDDSQYSYTGGNGTSHAMPPKAPIGGLAENGTKPHCPHCGSYNLTLQSAKRYYCMDCKKRSVESKLVWK